MNAKVGAWTNPSVLAWAGDRDPVEVAHLIAANLLEKAQRLGLSGPPIDVIGLARSEDIAMRPANEIGDAQIESAEATGSRGLVISYNPSRPRGRLRFSIAHELAHAQFPDVREQIRQRTRLGAVANPSDDRWELELLCNIVAADLLMPPNGLIGLANTATDIDFLMEQRRRWDVSTEALLRRYVSLASRSIALVATSRLSRREMRVDYISFSELGQTADGLSSLGHGDVVGAGGWSDVVAVGQTARGTLAIGDVSYQAQAVGVAPYPGSRDARVLALVEPDTEAASTRVEHVLADLLDADGDSIIYVQVSSDSVHSWSRFGVGASLASHFPGFATSYRMWTIADSSHLQLGQVHYVDGVEGTKRVAVATLVAQNGFGAGSRGLRYDALATGLARVREIALKTGGEVHVPRLGAGQAGGRWDLIEGLLDHELAAFGVRVVVHTKPYKGNAR